MSTLTIEFNKIHTAVCCYYLPVIFFIGLFGNLANIIMFHSDNLRKNVCSWYFICLSIAQILLLLVNGLYRIISTGWSNAYDLSQTLTDLCKFRVYGYVFSVAVCRHFLCLISLDRWMKTSRSATIRGKSSPKYGRWLITCSFIFWIIFEIHIPIGYPNTSNGGCIPISGSTYQLFYSIYNIVIGIGPVIFMILFSLLIQNNVRRRVVIVHPAPISAQTTSNNQLITRQHKTDFQLIRLSIIQIIFFLIFNIVAMLFPFYSFMTSSQTKSADRRAIETLISNIGQYLLITYAASTFGLYTLASSIFRQETKKYFQRITQKCIRILNNH